MRVLPSRSQAAQLLPPVLAAFLSCLFIVINPLAALSPPFSFLVLTIQILYFYPSGTLVAQIESSALAFAGAFVGLGYSNLFLYFAVLANRTVRGLGTTSDNDPGVAVDEQNRDRLDPLEVSPFDQRCENHALSRSLDVGQYLKHSKSRNPVAKGSKGDVVMHPPFIQGKLQQTMYEGDHAHGHAPPFQNSLPGLAECMCHALGVCAQAVDDTYNWTTDAAGRRQYNFPAIIKRLISPSSKLSSGDMEKRSTNIRDQLLAIQRDLESCVEGYETDLLIWLDTDVFASPSSLSPNNGAATACPVAKVSLADIPSTAFVRARMFEQKLQQHMRAPQVTGHSGWHKRANMRKAHEARLKATSWLVAMLDLVDKADKRGFTDRGTRRSRIWFPKLGKHWLTKAPSKGRLVDDMGSSSSAVQKHAELESAEREESEDAAVAAQHRLAGTLTRDERDVHLQRQAEDRRDAGAGGEANSSEKGESKTSKPRPTLSRNMLFWWKRIDLSWKLWWTSERSLQSRCSLLSISTASTNLLSPPSGRIRLSKWLSSAKHSKHIHYAFKMALGGMLLALPAFLPLGSKGRNWFTQSKGQWSLISYLYVLDITTGATFRVGIWRLIGTISGAIVGYVGYIIARGTSYGLVAVATVASLPIAWIMLYSTYPGIGIVAGITLPPILFIPYLSHLPYSQVILIALWRAEQVALGIVAAFLINSFIFPYHARVRYFYVLATTLDRLAELYLTMSRDNLRPSLVYTANMEQYTMLEQSIESGISQCQSLAQIQHLEVSLLPKPYKLHLRLNQSLSRILELLVEIRMLRLSIPRRETVLDVLPLRQDLVSSVYMTLFAIGHASRSRSPLPQFLPSPRDALNKWGKAVERLLGESRPPSGTQSPVPSESGGHAYPRGLKTSNAMDLAALYAFAEREALSRLCDVLDETVEIARGLFGIQAFLEPKILPTEAQEQDL
ncbi:hypothetical protein QFC24_003869 [Naganishia onofrii]|uniref:Uncharacterized protein n=1 Tax=Naganishia onofrii TaxID=1851511 RepID=A0ACC2XG80_9TREE|nr:hypothetical protein QFC24_003869 [Naganishia onofrii]